MHWKRVALAMIALGTLEMSIEMGVGAAAAQSNMIAGRQQSFKSMGGSFKAINDQVRRPSPDVAVIKGASAKLRQAADQFATQNWFPKGSGREAGAKTDASPAIWSNAGEFARMRGDLRKSAQQLSAAAAKGDVGSIKLATKAVGQSCSACHKKFRLDD